jgi:DNA invertase Pin-like site-specific DNA recombinase
MSLQRKKQKKQYSPEELYNPQIDRSRDACLYGRQSTKKQYVENIQSHIAQTLKQIEYTKRELLFTDDGSTGKAILFIENQVVDENGNVEIKNASGSWAIEKRPGLQTICEYIENGTPEGRRVGVVIAEFVDRLFRDEDRIDSNRFIKICKENDVYVHISSKRMTYNFANSQHVELFRLEVQMAAAYIENHVRGTMLRRRAYAVEDGKWAGVGRIPMGLTVDKDPESRYYGKFIPYEPHMEITRSRLFERFIELGFNLDLLCDEILQQPVIYPPFEPGVFVGNRGAKKLADGSYMLSSISGIKGQLTQLAFIGIYEREGKIIYDNHPAGMDTETFWLVYDRIKTTRPDGTPTGKTNRVSYLRKEDAERRLPLLKKLITSTNGARAYYVNTGVENRFYYQLATVGIKKQTYCCIDAEVLEQLIVDLFFQTLRQHNLVDIETARRERKHAQLKRLQKITEDIGLVEEEINRLIENMGKLTLDSVIQRTEVQIAKLISRQTALQAEAKQIEQTSNEEELGSLEEELADLEELWDEKPFLLKKSLLEIIIDKIVFDQKGTRFYSLQVVWKVKEWGVQHTYIDRGNGNKLWSREEEEILYSLYPTAPTKEDMLQALPTRTWEGIEKRASVLRIRREGRTDDKIDHTLAYRDRLFLEEENLSFSSFAPVTPGYKFTGWT